MVNVDRRMRARIGFDRGLAGACLPKGHRSSRSAKFKVPPGVLWATLTNVSAFPEWRADVKKVEILANAAGPKWREDGSNGSITYEQVEASAPNRLVTRIADPSLPFGGTWTFQILPAGSRSSVTITEDGEVYNVFFRFLSRFVFGHASSINAYLNSLGKKFGETVSIKSQL
jgi:uncharacterized protein YndB with AHSA1/START domain